MTRRTLQSWLVAVACAAAACAPAAASAATLAVTNDGQDGAVSTVPQAPLVLTARGACDHPYGVDEANGAASPCPAGTWPAQGSTDWALPTPLDTASGDQLRLRFDAPMASVSVAETTDNTPGGSPNSGSVTMATASPDATTWLVDAPFGPQVAVTAKPAGSGASSNYVFAVSTPRWEDESAKCGLAFVFAGYTQNSCPGPCAFSCTPGTFLPAGAGAAGLPPTKVSITAATRLTAAALRIGVAPSVPGVLSVRLRQHFRNLVLRSAGSVLPGAAPLTLPLSAADARFLARHPRSRITLTVTLASPQTGRTATAKSALRLRR